MIRALFEQVATPPVSGRSAWSKCSTGPPPPSIAWTARAFFQTFEEDHAVQYFYEPFLEAFDPELRKELGVWYTPPEIVQYQVARVDAVLREELGLADGLADPNVVVLDPCCGTGAYLRDVLSRIAETLQDKGGDALVANDLKKAAMERVFGFEILPAPFVVAHLQLGLVLETLGAPLERPKRRRARRRLPDQRPHRLGAAQGEAEADLLFPGLRATNATPPTRSSRRSRSSSSSAIRPTTPSPASAPKKKRAGRAVQGRA